MGANTSSGTYGGGHAQRGLQSYEQLLERFAKVKPNDKRLVFVQLLLYDMSNRQAPTVDDARKWAKHFRLDRRKNVLVLVADSRYIGRASFNMVPGFQLIDRNFVLRSDSTGHSPKDDLYTKLFPMVKSLLKERAKRPFKKSKPAGPKKAAPKAAKLLRSAENYAQNGRFDLAQKKVEAALKLPMSEVERARAELLLAQYQARAKKKRR